MTFVGKPITCKAAVLRAFNKPFEIEDVEVAVPKNGEVRIQMASTGVCHSDVHFIEGIIPEYPLPSILGHEGAGFVESVGEGVTTVAPGDLVVLLFESNCGTCATCKHPGTNKCLRQPSKPFQMDGTSRITSKGQAVSQMMSTSTFSEYTVTSEFNVTKVNPKANANRLCLAGCCIPTGYGAVINVSKVPPGATCAVWGLGGVGMCVVMGCKDAGASKIIGIDLNPNKFELAKELGCTDVLNPKDLVGETVPQALSKKTNGGVDFCFASVGIVSVFEEAFASSHPLWGETVLIGITEMGSTMKTGIWELLFGRKLRGTYYGGYKAKQGIPGLVDKIVDGQIKLDKLVSHVLPFHRINEGFDLLKKGESIRTVIDFGLEK